MFTWQAMFTARFRRREEHHVKRVRQHSRKRLSATRLDAILAYSLGPAGGRRERPALRFPSLGASASAERRAA
jgi:hypothetical protein